MPAPKNAMEIFQLLDKSNCRLCGEKTCLAFAGAVFVGRRRLGECPHLDPATICRYSTASERLKPVNVEGEAYLKDLQAKIREVDLSAAARRIGGRVVNGKLGLKVLGKDFSVDAAGRLYADIHVNPWVAVPFLNYVLYGGGRKPKGDWVPLRELGGGKSREAIFRRRCEMPMQRLADTQTDFFDDIIHMFSGRQVARQFQSDISVVLHPLPRIPLMICYWKPEEGLGSSLNLFFDRTADANLDIESIFSLGVGFLKMLQQLSLRHGFTNTAEEG